MPEVETPEEVAENPAPAEDVRTIGGTYVITDEESGGEIIFNIPTGTQSDPSATFSGTYKEPGVPDKTYTGTYDHPSFEFQLSNGFDSSCTVADDAESMVCEFAGFTKTLTRQ
ncbi:hypothetical protein PN498_14215 [Oscillatoria sp. CS-180]|uniref:hypothetical protein n=1 Tax=Oscillatoria sp. CS-180 TaxID=3021720 RepID=UPI00232DD7A7|nr:hypothetical protein [Oscillatoria sp. CS-180]MDB9527152.1 hypothetical protein [Oscillatoria sp. CS-180]